MGDRVLLRTKELLDASDIGKLRPRCLPEPNPYTLALPRKMRCSPTEELAHCPEKVAEYDAAAPRRRAARRAGPGAAPAPAPASSRTAALAAATCGTRRVPARGSIRGRYRPGPRGPAGAVLLANWLGRWLGAVVSRGTRMSSGTTGGRRWALLWLIRSSMPLRTARGGGGRCSALCASPGPSL